MRDLLRSTLQLAGVAAAGLLAAGMFAFPSIAADDVAAGKMLYGAKCTGCHSVDADRIGPRHRDVVGRKIASVPGFNYSPAIKKLGGAWTPARLDQWLSGTQKMAPGSKMYLKIDDPHQRRLLIAYLESVSKPR
jgi:cytochrome c